MPQELMIGNMALRDVTPFWRRCYSNRGFTSIFDWKL